MTGHFVTEFQDCLPPPDDAPLTDRQAARRPSQEPTARKLYSRRLLHPHHCNHKTADTDTMHAAQALLPSLSCTGAAPPPLLLRLRPAALYLAIPAVTSYPSVLVLRIKKIAHSQWVHKQLGSSKLRPRDDAQRARGEAWQGRGVRVRDYAKRGTSWLAGRRSMSSAARIGLDGPRGRMAEGMVREELLELPGDAATTGAAFEDGEVEVIALDVGTVNSQCYSSSLQLLDAIVIMCDCFHA